MRNRSRGNAPRHVLIGMVMSHKIHNNQPCLTERSEEAKISSLLFSVMSQQYGTCNKESCQSASSTLCIDQPHVKRNSAGGLHVANGARCTFRKSVGRASSPRVRSLMKFCTPWRRAAVSTVSEEVLNERCSDHVIPSAATEWQQTLSRAPIDVRGGIGGKTEMARKIFF